MTDLEYRYFYEVARTLNFNQAAENLFLSQPALSRCIFKIEQEFGVSLFIRTKRSVTLTEAGLALLNHYPLVQKANQELYEKVQGAAHGVNSLLKIGIQEGHLLTPHSKQLLTQFQSDNTDVKLSFISIPYMNLFDQLNQGTIDLAFSLEFPNNIYSDVQHQCIETKNSYIFISKDHPLAQSSDPAKELTLLNNSDLIIVKWSIVPNATNYILHQCDSNGFTPANIRYAPSYLTLCNWLIMDKGFAIMDDGTLLENSMLQRIPLPKENLIDFCVYWHNKRPSSATVRFISYLSNMHTSSLTETE